MTIRQSIVIALLIAGGLAAGVAKAQDVSPPLVQFVEEAENGSLLQLNIATAVQRICPALAQTPDRDPGQDDLFLRCNEMIGTSVDFNTGEPSPNRRSLGYTDPDELLQALQQVWGEEMHSNGNLTTRLSSGQFANIAGRLNALRLGAASAGMGGRLVASNPYDPQPNSVASNDVSTSGLTGGAAAGDTDVAGSRWGWFLEGSFNTGDRDQTASENAFDFDSSSFTLGTDYLFDRGVIGVSIGVDAFDAEFQNTGLVRGGDVKLDGVSGSVFGAWFGDRFYADGIATLGTLDNDSNRNLIYDSTDACDPACPPQNRTITGETEGDFLNLGATVGFGTNFGKWDLDTTFSLSYRDISIDGFDEVDADPAGGMALRYDEQTIKSFRSIVGFTFTGFFSQSFGVLSPQLRAEWHHEFEDDPVTLRAKYVLEDTLGTVDANDFTSQACLSCAAFLSDDIDTDFGVIGLGVSAIFSQRYQLYFVYDALVGMRSMTSNAFSVGLRGQF